VTGISHITKLNDHDWLLETADAEALSKELLGFTLQHNLNIVSLQTQTRRLEDIFRELTEANN
jgi:hypothetical protein